MNKINILILKSDEENIVFSVLQVNTKWTFWMKMDIMTGLLSLTERQHKIRAIWYRSVGAPGS